MCSIKIVYKMNSLGLRSEITWWINSIAFCSCALIRSSVHQPTKMRAQANTIKEYEYCGMFIFMSHNSQFSEMNSIEMATSVVLLQNYSRISSKPKMRFNLNMDFFVAKFFCWYFFSWFALVFLLRGFYFKFLNIL